MSPKTYSNIRVYSSVRACKWCAGRGTRVNSSWISAISENVRVDGPCFMCRFEQFESVVRLTVDLIRATAFIEKYRRLRDEEIEEERTLSEAARA